MEALQCGTPVVVSADTGCSELVSALGGGRAVNEDDASLAEALGTILDNRATFAHAAARAGSLVCEQFGRARICAELERRYVERVGTTRRG
jgi:glycosyltransferase involved in cell wall biosynthesis